MARPRKLPGEKRKTLSICLPPALLEKLEHVKSIADESSSAVIQRALKWYLTSERGCERCGCTELLCGHNKGGGHEEL